MALPTLKKLDPPLPWGELAKKRLNDLIDLIVDASDTGPGLVELATNAESTTGTATNIATTPAGVKAVIDALLAAANTWTAGQTIQVTTAGTFALDVQAVEAGAAVGPIVRLYRDSASPAAFDLLGAFHFYGKDSGGNAVLYGSLSANNTDPTDASEDGQVRIATIAAGAFSDRVIVEVGVRIGTPTGGDKGAGTLNLDNALYKDGTQVVSDRRTGWAATTGTEIRTNFGDASLAETSQALRALIVDLKAHGLIGA